MEFETENVEFKLRFTEEIYKEVIAFANTDGGVVYVGIDNDGNAVGLENVDDEYTRITNGIRDAIMPDVTMFVKFTIQDNRVVRISVGEGSNKPYYLKSKGLKSSGVYVRQGTSSAQASPEQIRKMIKDSDGDNFEEMRSLNQSLTFKATENAFKKYGVEFGENKYFTLGITQPNNNLFSNLALILSEQCEHTIKVAVFADESKTFFKDSKEFGGSVFTQLEDTFNYLKLCNKTAATFKGLERIEKSDYPEEAIREALLNSIVHRDYGYSGSVIINVNDDEIEFISIGGLPQGLSTEDIKTGISQPRNKKLAEIFHRLHLIESYGTGIRKIYNLYADCECQPEIRVTQNTFKIILPNMNTAMPINSKEVKANKITPQMEKVMDYISKNGCISEQEIQDLLGVKHTRAYTIAKQMRDMDIILVKGRGEEKVYVLNV